jgi:hypothetical protein
MMAVMTTTMVQRLGGGAQRWRDVIAVGMLTATRDVGGDAEVEVAAATGRQRQQGSRGLPAALRR